jgi:hypothetical protein
MRRQIDFDDQSAVRCVHRADRSAMNIHGAFGDGEAKPGAVRIAVGDTAKRQEDFGEHAFRHSRPVIAYSQQRTRVVQLQ